MVIVFVVKYTLLVSNTANDRPQIKQSKNRESHYDIAEQKNGVNRLNTVQKATYLKKKSKLGINEMYSNC